MSAPTTAVPSMAGRLRLEWAGLDPLADLRVQYGIKVGLAAVLSLWIAQALRLEHPNWSILAVLVLANGHYVGTIATKALMRAIGTVAGGLIGVWLIGDYANSPVVFLFWLFVVVAIATYKSGQLASATWPYAYYLMGLALVSAATYGITDPANVWRIALSRTLETLVGVAAATGVYALLWPRYAREEFISLAAKTVTTVRSLLAAESGAYRGEAVDPHRVLDLRGVFSQQVLGLRTLLNVGGRGSTGFRSRLGNYQRFVVAMTQLFHALQELQRRRAEEDALLDLVRPEIDRYLVALDNDLAVLENVAAASRNLPPTALSAAFAALETRVHALRDQGTFRHASIAAGEAFFGHFAALRLVHDELTTVHQLVGELPRVRLPAATSTRRHTVLPAVNWFWVREAIKGGLATGLSFLLIRWVHPPGATGIPLGAWLFGVFGRMSLQTGGTGDQRTFQRMFKTVVAGIPIVAGLWLIMPLLSNYWAMNVFLFGLCYWFGFVTATSAGLSFGLQILVLAISTLVSINPQEPVAFHTLRDAFFGLMIGLILGGTVSRLVWPVLPQGMFRRNLIEFFGDLRNLLKGADNPQYVLTNAVLLPLEALRSVSSMVLPQCPASERQDLENFIRVAHPLGMQITALREKQALPLAASVQNLLRAPLASLDAKLDQSLAALAACLRRRSTQGDFPDLRRELEAVNGLLLKARDEGVVTHEDFTSVAHLLELMDRYGTVTERLLDCQARLTKLCLERYLYDVAL